MTIPAKAAIFALMVAAIVGAHPSRAANQRQPASAPSSGASTATVTIPVEGMSCASCAASIKKTLKSLEGVIDAEVSLEHRRVRVEYVKEKVLPRQMVAAINELGYKAGEPKEEAGR